MWRDGEETGLEVAEAICHVISRGKYRKEELPEDGSARDFEKTAGRSTPT